MLAVLVAIALSCCLQASEVGGTDPRVSIEPRVAVRQQINSFPRTDIRVDSTTVLIPVTVVDPTDRVVTGLRKSDFRVFQDSKEEKISEFFSEDAPVSLGIIFDSSGSMGGKLAISREAVAAFLKTANPDDEFFLITFNTSPQLVTGFTRDQGQILNSLTFAQSSGQTALLDSVVLALHQMKKAKNSRRALLIVSDGGDNSSRYTEGEVRRLEREADVQIYTIGIFEPVPARRTLEELEGPAVLSDIAEESGGRDFAVRDLGELPDIAARIGIELRNQYVLGYSPESLEHDGKYHRLRVKLIEPKGLPRLHVTAKAGYYAPQQ